MATGYFRRGYRAQVPVYAVAIAWSIVVLALAQSKGVLPGIGGVLGNAKLFLASGVVFLTLDLFATLWRERPDSPIACLKQRYGDADLRRAFLAGVPLLLIVIVLMPLFSMMKSMIPLFNDYTWDATFIAWDRALFFGQDAWRVLQPVFGYPVVTALIAVAYHLWMLLIYPGVLMLIYHPRVSEDTKRRFFFCYVLAWALVGGALATWLASVGPAFLEPLTGDATFAPQMAYLNAANEQVPVMTLTVQGLLLDWFHADESGLGSGITAMPSMHVAIAFLYWLACREIDPKLGRAALVFLIVIWIGSVHTAYHYAVDGIVSGIAVLALWLLSKPVFTIWDRFSMRTGGARVQPESVPAE